MATREATYAQEPTWHAEQPRLRAPHLVLQWIVSAIALLVAAWIVPGPTSTGSGARCSRPR